MHVLQSKHIKLNSEEAKLLLEKLNIISSQLPKITKNDPVLALMDINAGDIIKITRKSGEVYYRIVVH